jgi:hypothetical protein
MSFDTDPYMTVELAGEDVDTSAWFCINKADLLGFAPQDEAFDELPGQHGTFPYEEFDTQQTVDLQFVMTGVCEPDGTPYTNPAAGLAANKRLFAATYFRVALDEFGLTTCSAVDVDGTEYAGAVKVRPLMEMAMRLYRAVSQSVEVMMQRNSKVASNRPATDTVVVRERRRMVDSWATMSMAADCMVMSRSPSVCPVTRRVAGCGCMGVEPRVM